ncbi:MAG: DDE transposase family protein [Prevotellaceae bacterium]|jgi:predicted transcriptional regulator|nr:DDE transposase family protein [Prevotellaceae bacterium]
MNLSIKQKKELAQILFTRNSLTQKEVAKQVGVSEQAMSRWVCAGKWDEIRTSITVTREEQLRRLYNQIAEYNTAIEKREDGLRFASSKEADAINKLATAIDKLEKEVGVKDILDVSKKFLDWLRKFDLKRAQELSELFDAFLKENIK